MKIQNKAPFQPLRTTVVAIALAAAMSQGLAIASPGDLDEDKITNRLDRDVDGDGIPNGKDRNVDGGICRKGPLKGKFVGDHFKNIDPREKDIDDDGKSDKIDDDIDGDGIRNGKDDDCDGDGKGRAKDKDDDSDGIEDGIDSDDDNDGISDDDENEVEIRLSAGAAAPDGSRARAKVKLSPSGEIELEIDSRGLDAGDYDVVVDGQTLGTLTLVSRKGRTEGEVHFETQPDKSDELPLPFNPFGLPVTIEANGTTYFSGTVPTPTDVFIDDNGDDDTECNPDKQPREGTRTFP